MRVAVIGGGPAGLYFAYLLKRSFPNASIDIFEQNPAHVTWGFGVVFSDQALGFLTEDDPETLDYITPWMETWKDLTLDLMGKRVLIDGIGFAAIGRLKLLQLLHDRASSVGLSPRFHTRVDDLSVFDSHDLVVGADAAVETAAVETDAVAVVVHLLGHSAGTATVLVLIVQKCSC